MKKLVVPVLALCVVQGLASQGFADERAGRPSCIQTANALADREGREVATKYMKYGFESFVVSNPPIARTPEGADEPVLGAPNDPTFIILSEKSAADPAKRAQMIADNYLVSGDMIYLVMARVKPDFVQAIRADARADWGIENGELMGPAGNLIARCRQDRPSEVEQIWWQKDVEAR